MNTNELVQSQMNRMNDNVIGVDYGIKYSQRMPNFQQESLRFLVQKKSPKSEIPTDEIIPDEIGGVPTDVIEIGEVWGACGLFPSASYFQCKHGQLSMGVSIGAVGVTGTFGAVVRSRETGKLLGLSNQHVLVNPYLTQDTTIQHPGMLDGPSHSIGKRIRATEFRADRVDNLDAGVFELTGIPVPASNGLDTTLADASMGGHVWFYGRTSGYSAGFVTGVNGTLRVGFVGGSVFTFSTRL